MDIDARLKEITNFFTTLQDCICKSLEEIDDKTFESTNWSSEIGNGTSNTILGGKIFEKGGVNFSHISGNSLPSVASSRKRELANIPFAATGISLVIHPLNPYVPTVHMNLRFFTLTKPPFTWWFGGGCDLTPYFPFEEDCIFWHQSIKDACSPFGEEIYPEYKKWCDEYFYLKHRDETRGIGGIFFDDLNKWEFDKCFSFIKAIGNIFLPSYLSIVNKRKNINYDETHKKFHMYRRGRYVEFNLIYDRGTLFGLKFGGRTESILVSLPPTVSWDNYNYEKEEEQLKPFLIPHEWLKKA